MYIKLILAVPTVLLTLSIAQAKHAHTSQLRLAAESRIQAAQVAESKKKRAAKAQAESAKAIHKPAQATPAPQPLTKATPAPKAVPVAPAQPKATVYRVPAGGCAAYAGIIGQYPWPVQTAIAVCNAESGGNPNAANWSDNHGVCMGSFGLFQISCHGGQIYDPAANVSAAFRKYQHSGWRPWGVCTSGKVRCW